MFIAITKTKQQRMTLLTNIIDL